MILVALLKEPFYRFTEKKKRKKKGKKASFDPMTDVRLVVVE
jgi:hypothetical protein